MTLPELKDQLATLKAANPGPEGGGQRRGRSGISKHGRGARCPPATRHHQGRSGHRVGNLRGLKEIYDLNFRRYRKLL